MELFYMCVTAVEGWKRLPRGTEGSGIGVSKRRDAVRVLIRVSGNLEKKEVNEALLVDEWGSAIATHTNRERDRQRQRQR
ncbi:hypothetical protein PanWU01x14_150710 [Parasponia andersonii]|uniref:Uncharacterized protein n=1 Tax=Parasponia andersonii TaxID=3476 RepID=A0A2P5CHZ8_PARAD|nr:hypothetical protein PanWU01x14_150710 [Parasponia andersonii]